MKPDISINLGDCLDCEVFGRHPSSGIQEKTYTYETDEVEPLQKLLDTIQKYSKKTVYIEGNHEHRISRWCSDNGRIGKIVWDKLAPEKVLTKGRKAFEWIPYGKDSYYKVTNDLVAIHGWSFCKAAAAKHLELSRTKSVIFGHTHRAQTEQARDRWTEKPLMAMSGGCLCDLQPIYLTTGSPTAWVHGFVVGYIGRSGFQMYPVQIVGNQLVMPDGKKIKA